MPKRTMSISQTVEIIHKTQPMIISAKWSFTSNVSALPAHQPDSMKLLATSITAEQPLLKLHRTTTEYFITDINRCQEIHVQQ